MSWNSGVFTRAAGATACQDESNGGTGVISSVQRDADINDLVAGINLCWLADGTKPLTGNLNLNNFNIINIDTLTGNAPGMLTVDDNLTVTGTTSLNDAVSITGAFSATGGASISNGATVYGGLTSDSDFQCFGAALVTGLSTLTGGATLGAALTVNAASTFNDSISVEGNAAISGVLHCAEISNPDSATVAINDGLAVTGTFTAAGLITALDDVYIHGGFTADSGMTSNGNIDLNGNNIIDVGEITGDTSINGNLTVTGAINGNNISSTKQSISGTGTQSFDLDNGWLADNTISGTQDLEFSNGVQGANGIIKLINTNGNTFDLSGTGLTFKKSGNGVLEAYAQITLEAGASTEQIITYHFQSDTEVIYTVSS